MLNESHHSSGEDTPSRYMLDRRGSIYMQIEKCETSYELRYAIAYEAAIRNSEVQTLLNDCIQNENCEQIKNRFGFTDEALIYYRLTHSGMFPPRTSGVTSDGLATLRTDNLGYERKRYVLKPICSDSVVVNSTPFTARDNEISIASIENYTDFRHLLFEANIIRPKLMPIKKKEFLVNLNFELPESELHEYIEYLYEAYHKESVHSPIELLSDLELHHSKQIKANAQKYADMLYVYDYAIKFKDKFDTDIKLHEKIAMDLHYSDGRDSTNPPETNTIRNYRKKMEYLVSDLGYLELLTGIKQ